MASNTSNVNSIPGETTYTTNSTFPPFTSTWNGLTLCTVCNYYYYYSSGAGHMCMTGVGTIGGLGSGGLTIGGYTYPTTIIPTLPTQLLRYSPNSRCRKCSSKKQPIVVYCHLPATNSCYAEASHQEHLHLTCGKCTYKWIMLTTDTELPEDLKEGL